MIQLSSGFSCGIYLYELSIQDWGFSQQQHQQLFFAKKVQKYNITFLVLVPMLIVVSVLCCIVGGKNATWRQEKDEGHDGTHIYIEMVRDEYI